MIPVSVQVVVVVVTTGSCSHPRKESPETLFSTLDERKMFSMVGSIFKRDNEKHYNKRRFCYHRAFYYRRLGGRWRNDANCCA
jgi:hypothetical protein